MVYVEGWLALSNTFLKMREVLVSMEGLCPIDMKG